VWASIHLLNEGGEILVADVKGGGREHYNFPVDDKWFKIKTQYMEQKGLSLWTVDPSKSKLSKWEKEEQFNQWMEKRNLA
jgi:hypothetical protein